MDNITSNQINMIDTTIRFCDDNISVFSGITVFGTVFDIAKNKRILITEYNKIASVDTKGVTLDSKNLRKAMTSVAFKCGSATSSYADSVKNETLKATVNYSITDLNRLKKDEVDDVCENIRDAANDNITEVSKWGATANDVSDLQSFIALYRLSIQSPRMAIISRSVAKKQIKQLVREIIDDVFVGQMDKMVDTLKETNADIVKKYYAAREIIDLGSTSTKFRGTTKTKDKTSIANVRITLKDTKTKEIAAETTSDIDGIFSVSVKPGNYDIIVEREDYQTIIGENVRFGPGKEVIKNFVLIP